MATVMLDVGARNGESLEEFLRWDFDTVYAFEPMPAQYDGIVARFDDPNLVVNNYGLSDMTGTKVMYGADIHGEASVFASKVDLDASVTTECQFRRASEFFEESIAFGDIVYMKLNCEGSEVAILNDLIDSGQLWKVKCFRVEFDISRCVGFEHEADKILARLDAIGYTNYTIGSDARLVNGGLVDRVAQEGTHHGRLRAWLESVW